jgi:7-carboxy-7-deazaguanine synthase
MGIKRRGSDVSLKYPISEIFTSIKGEGLDIGKKACFVRFYGCNLNCSFCDSNYATQGNDFKEMTVDDVLGQVPKGLPVTITGGEPLLYDLVPLITSLLRREGRQRQIEIETNGTTFRKLHYVDFTVSPKMEYMSDRYKDSLKKFELCNATFKFVVGSRADFDGVMSLLDEISLSKVVLMPEGITPERIIHASRDIAEWMLAYPDAITHVQLIPRLHILLWGNQRGR